MRTRGTPAMKVIVQFADGTSAGARAQERRAHSPTRSPAPTCRSAREAGDFTRRGQLRYFALNLGKQAALSKIVLESYDNDIVPVTVAITASADPVPAAQTAAPAGAQAPASASTGAGRRPKEGGKGDAPLPETKPIVWAPGKTKVLIIAGGSAHNFGKFFGETDGATLSAAGFSVNYTEDRDQAAAELATPTSPWSASIGSSSTRRRIARRCSISRPPARASSCCTRARGTASPSGPS